MDLVKVGIGASKWEIVSKEIFLDFISFFAEDLRRKHKCTALRQNLILLPINYKNKGIILMKSNAKALIALSIGLILLTTAISTNQFDLVQEIIKEITKSAKAGIPVP
ncbi:MAG: hypothetical protein ACFFDC_00405 [Promethearchaeota archaeon]